MAKRGFTVTATTVDCEHCGAHTHTGTHTHRHTKNKKKNQNNEIGNHKEINTNK